jgi:two-component sensor histidine kinase
LITGDDSVSAQTIDGDYTLVSIAYTKALIERPRCNRPKGRGQCSFRVDQFPRFGRNHVTKSVRELPALSERTLLDELNHRINNEFASAINLVAVSALRSNNVSVKAALGNVCRVASLKSIAR